MQDIFKIDGLNYKSKCGKTYNFGKYSLRDRYEWYLSLQNADNKQSNFATELKNFDKGIKTFERSLF